MSVRSFAAGAAAVIGVAVIGSLAPHVGALPADSGTAVQVTVQHVTGLVTPAL